jgi:hypothetical protein
VLDEALNLFIIIECLTGFQEKRKPKDLSRIPYWFNLRPFCDLVDFPRALVFCGV